MTMTRDFWATSLVEDFPDSGAMELRWGKARGDDHTSRRKRAWQDIKSANLSPAYEL